MCKDLMWHINFYLHSLTCYLGYDLAQLVEALRYKSEVRGIDRCCGVIVLNFPVALWPWDQSEMSTKNISWGQKRSVFRVDNLTNFMRQLSRESDKLMEISGLVQACNRREKET